MSEQSAERAHTARPWARKRVVFLSPGQVAAESYAEHNQECDEIFVETVCSLISAGTEGVCLSGKANWVRYPHYPGYSNAGRILTIFMYGTGFSWTEDGKPAYPEGKNMVMIGNVSVVIWHPEECGLRKKS